MTDGIPIAELASMKIGEPLRVNWKTPRPSYDTTVRRLIAGSNNRNGIRLSKEECRLLAHLLIDLDVVNLKNSLLTTRNDCE